MNSSSISGYIEEYGKDVYSFCVYLTRNREDAEDLYQQTFLTALSKPDDAVTGNPKSFLISIAANHWRNERRKRIWRNEKAGIVHFGEGDADAAADLRPNAEEDFIKNDEIMALRENVKKLADKYRVTVLMFYMEEMSLKEIASALHVPVGTVKSRLNKAKSILKEMMADYER
ncbi:MAG: RNA polymerase sigma factor [Lachnospiraceae bacterium]|nr:RNA polymerase sigma factor [Lachnospiraceae bacterium]